MSEDGKKVVDISGKEVDVNEKPDGALLDLARDFLANVEAGKVKIAAVVTDSNTVGFVGDPLEVLAYLARAVHEANLRIDEGEEEEEAS